MNQQSLFAGVDVGTTFTGAAVVRDDQQAEAVPLGRQRTVMPTVVWLGPDGATQFGEAAVRRRQGNPGGCPVERSASANEGHLAGLYREEQDVRLCRQASHMNNGIGSVTYVHHSLGPDRTISLRHAN